LSRALGNQSLRTFAQHCGQQILPLWWAQWNYRILTHGGVTPFVDAEIDLDNRIPAGHAAFFNSGRTPVSVIAPNIAEGHQMWLTHLVRRSLSKPYALPLNTIGAEFVRMGLGVATRRSGLFLGLYDPLTQLAAKHKSDKGVTVFPFHGYSVHYAKLFERIRDKPINILEIGLARRTDRDTLGITCPSLSMWLDYFPKANVYGFDIDDFSWVKLPRTHILRGDQGSAEDLRKVAAQCPGFDVIIDDGSHASYHQQLTLKVLFTCVVSNGLYIIEDLRWQPEDLEAALPRVQKTRDLLKNSSALSQTITGAKEILFFDSPIEKGKGKEGLAVIVKA